NRGRGGTERPQLRPASRTFPRQALPSDRPPDRGARRARAGAQRLFADAGNAGDRRGAGAARGVGGGEGRERPSGQVGGGGREAMLKPEVIGSTRSTYTRVVRMVCEEKGIDYVLTEAELGAPEILAIHPFGKMPVMRHGDVELFESKAIATYLDRRFPGLSLFPSEPVPAALAEQWVSVVNTLVDRTLIRTYLLAYAAPKTADGKPDRQAIEAVTPALREQIGVLDKAVARTGYLVDDQYTFA